MGVHGKRAETAHVGVGAARGREFGNRKFGLPDDDDLLVRFLLLALVVFKAAELLLFLRVGSWRCGGTARVG
jgi:hypothetical protein